MYRPIQVVHTSPPTDRYIDRLLSGSTADWGCFRPVTTRNRPSAVDFGGINQGREKEEGGEGAWSHVRCYSQVPPCYLSLAGEESPTRSVARGRFLRKRAIPSPSAGRHFVSPTRRRNEATSDSDRSSRGRPSVAKEHAVLPLDSGRNCTQSDDGRKLRALARPSDPSIGDKGRLNPLRLQWRQR
ncbi:hypothetical protein BHE74_00025114 [Ensete ventricosum]|nr:hypothetical protein BHE74_00025114 [Ensete ventricosum]